MSHTISQQKEKLSNTYPDICPTLFCALFLTEHYVSQINSERTTPIQNRRALLLIIQYQCAFL